MAIKRWAGLAAALLVCGAHADPEWRLTRTGEGAHIRALERTKIERLVHESAPCADCDSVYADRVFICADGPESDSEAPAECDTDENGLYHFIIPAGLERMAAMAQQAADNDWKVTLHIDTHDIQRNENGGARCAIRRLVVFQDD